MKDSLASRVRASSRCQSICIVRRGHGINHGSRPWRTKSLSFRWIGRVDPFDFRTLTAAECLVRIQAPDSFQQSLPPQDFVQASDTLANWWAASSSAELPDE